MLRAVRLSAMIRRSVRWNQRTVAREERARELWMTDGGWRADEVGENRDELAVGGGAGVVGSMLPHSFRSLLARDALKDADRRPDSRQWGSAWYEGA